MNPEDMQYNQYLSLAKLYLGEGIEYERPVEISDTYRNLRTHVRNASNLDKRLENPDYMKPTKSKLKHTGAEVQVRQTKPETVSKLSAFNADKKMAGVRMLVDGVAQKMRLPPVSSYS